MEDDIQNYLPTFMFRGTPVSQRDLMPKGLKFFKLHLSN